MNELTNYLEERDKLMLNLAIEQFDLELITKSIKSGLVKIVAILGHYYIVNKNDPTYFDHIGTLSKEMALELLEDCK